MIGGAPVVIAENGRGIPVTFAPNGTPVTIAENGRGFPVVMAENGYPVSLQLNPAPALWLRADTGITLNGDTVSAWRSRSNTLVATQSTEANQPTFDPDAINGRPGVVTDGGDFMRIPDFAYSTTRLTWFVVVDLVVGTTHFLAAHYDVVASQAAWNIIVGTTGSIGMQLSTDGSGVTTRSTVETFSSGPHIIVTQFGADGLVVRVDGTEYPLDAATGGGTLHNSTVDMTLLCRLNSGAANGLASNGTALSEFGFWDRDLSVAEISALEQYASTLYSIPLAS